MGQGRHRSVLLCSVCW